MVSYPYNTVMFNIISIFIGLLALVLAIIGFILLLGWTNWFIIALAGIGVLFGLISSKSSGMKFCLIVMGICALRLWMGGGLI